MLRSYVTTFYTTYILFNLHLPVKPEILRDARKLAVLSPPSRRIISGWHVNSTSEYERLVPYMVSFKKKKKIGDLENWEYTHFCGGTLLAANKIVTAAHCFYNKDVTTTNPTIYNCADFTLCAVMGLLAGSATATNPKLGANDANGQWRYLRSFKYMKDYQPGSFYDIGLVFTCINFSFDGSSGTFVPKVLPFAKKRENYVGKCTISGYGQKYMDEPHSKSKDLAVGHIHLIGDHECDNIVLPKNTSSDVVICGLLDNTYGGWGDSGGGLACEGTSNIEENKFVGILVGVYVAYLTNKNCLYVRVSTFAEFIDSPDPKTLRLQFSSANNALPKLNKAGVLATLFYLCVFSY